jgi:hypothetical protein
MKRKLLLLVALLAVTLASWLPASTQACTFCNLTGYSSCDSLNGTSCGVPGSNRRCYLLPACACEWSVCFCDGTTNTWNCAF